MYKGGRTVKYVGIKMGIRNSVHNEKVATFIKFLQSLKINQKVINELLKYHYGDGTLDGTGLVRQNVSEYKIEHEESIKLINKMLNNKYVIKKFIDRFLIHGTQKQFYSIDALIYGTPQNFIYITPKEIYKYILKNRNFESSTVHFSCLTYQPQARVLDFDKSKEYMREYMQIKWYNFEDNVIEILNNRK